jgi:hypothetical protein
MFRHIEGYKAHYGDMTLMLAHAFAEWHVVVVKHPTGLIQGERQITEEKARTHARQLVEHYIREEGLGDTSDLPSELMWVPLEVGDWLTWRL